MKKGTIFLSFLFFGTTLLAQNKTMFFNDSKPTIGTVEYEPSYKVQPIDYRALDAAQANYNKREDERERKADIENEKYTRMYQKLIRLADNLIKEGYYSKFNKWDEKQLRYLMFDNNGNKIGYFKYFLSNESLIYFPDTNF